MTRILDTDELIVEIDGEQVEVYKVRTYGYLPILDCGRPEFYVAQSTEAAGRAARTYWQEMADNDPKELTCLVGEETLVNWALGLSAGPGSVAVNSLDEWLDLWLDTPEEQWASYDGAERQVTGMSRALADELGWTWHIDKHGDITFEEWQELPDDERDEPFEPFDAVAYRWN